MGVSINGAVGACWRHDAMADTKAIRQIAKRIQNEETWKVVFKQIEQVCHGIGWHGIAGIEWD